ncbi:MAG TPA: ATP-binding protein [Planctomycetota bacterium]|nr:ATP-binding protein [Planctomycetota bacterium]
MPSTDLRLILHQIGNLAQPIAYHVEKLAEIRSDDPTFNAAMKALPERMAVFNRTIDRLRILAKPVELELGRVDLCALLKSVWNDVSNEKPFKSIKVKWNFGAPASSRLEAGAPVQGDSYWLHLALRELLLNAAEAAAQSASPAVEIQVSAKDKNWRIEINDSGPGLPAEAALGALFFTAKADTAAGLGLPIARHILDAHGGTLLFEPHGLGAAKVRAKSAAVAVAGDRCHVAVLLPQA